MGSLSRRISASGESPNILHSAWYMWKTDPHDSQHNPMGIINLGTSENRQLHDIVQKRLNSIDVAKMPEEFMHYCSFSGIPPFRDALCSFFTRYFEPQQSLCRDDVLVMNGCGSAIESIAYALCDEGDGILIPAPYYPGFKSDLEQRIGVQVYPIQLNSTININHGDVHEFQLTESRLEDALQRARRDGVSIKALLISNPNNPLGHVYTKDELTMILQFCTRHNIHLISDEIYRLSVHNENAEFTSTLSLDGYSENKDLIHVVWGFSKDFALSGFRCAAVVTKNKALQRGLTSVGYYTGVSALTQFYLTCLILDYEWLNKALIPMCRLRLRLSADYTTEKLSKSKIHFIRPSAGLFVWVDLRKYLRCQSLDEEIDLFNYLMKNKIYIVPGFAFGTNEFGWFRVIISVEQNVLEVGIDRLIAALHRRLNTISPRQRATSIQRPN